MQRSSRMPAFAALLLLIAVSLLSVPSPVLIVQAARPSPPLSSSSSSSRPPPWGIISSWKGWHASRRQRQQDVATVVHHDDYHHHHQQQQQQQQRQLADESLIPPFSDSLNYTAVTILHVGNDTTSSSSKQDISSSWSIPQPGCLLEYYRSTTIANDDIKEQQETAGWSFLGSKWMPGSSSTSRSAWTAQSGSNKNDGSDEDDDFLALAQAAAMTSHVVVLVLQRKTSSSSSSSLHYYWNPKIVQALQAGFARRHEQAGLAKGSLVLVLNNNDGPNDDGDDIDEWRNDLVLGDFKDMQPPHVHALELTSVQDYESTLDNLLREQRMKIMEQQDSHLVPLQAFPQLLQQTYGSLLASKESSRQRQSTTMASSLFDHDADSRQYTTTEQQDSSSSSSSSKPTITALPPLPVTMKAESQIVGGGHLDGRTTKNETSTSLLAASDDDDDDERVGVQSQVNVNPKDGSHSTTTAVAETTISTTMKTPATILSVDEKETVGSSNKVVLDAIDQQTTSHGGADPAAVVGMELKSQLKAATATAMNNKFTATVPEVKQSDVMNDSSLEQYEQEQEAAKVLLATCHERLDALEQEMEQVWFDATIETDDDDNGYTSLNDNSSSDELSSSTILLRTPPCDFAKAATPVLQELQQGLSTSLLSNQQLQDSVTATVGNRLSRLYQQYLLSLRDYHGKVYEAMLDSHANQPSGPWWRQRPFSRKRRPPNAARVEKDLQRTVKAFRNAAQEAVPPLARRGSPFRDMDLDYVNALQGLLADMQEAIALRESLIDLDKYEEDDYNDEAKRGGGLWGFIRRGRQQGAAATWYEKMAARAFVLSVNYLQGWLAWQALQRAALEREREMPKFPIF